MTTATKSATKTAEEDRPRTIAVLGGDDRAGRYSWPEGFDVRHYPGDEHARLVAALRAGRIASVVVVTKFISHAAEQEVRRAAIASGMTLLRWAQGFNELTKRIPVEFAGLALPEPILLPRIDIEEEATPDPPPPEPTLEDSVEERTRLYGEALVAARRAAVYVTELEAELERARKESTLATEHVGESHRELLAAIEKVR